jgi:hypothetical protein
MVDIPQRNGREPARHKGSTNEQPTVISTSTNEAAELFKAEGVLSII